MFATASRSKRAPHACAACAATGNADSGRQHRNGRSASPDLLPPFLARKCGSCTASEPSTALDAAGRDNPGQPASSGQPLHSDVRWLMQSRFGRSFADVRIHDDAAAHRSAAGLLAKAWTRGSDIYFAEGYYQPHTRSGRALLAHELTHVAQQAGGRGPADTGHLEREAGDVEAAFLAQRAQPQIRQAARASQVYRAGLSVAELRELTVGGIEAVADRLLDRYGDRVPGVAQLSRLRDELRGFQLLALTADELARLQSLYGRVRALAPGWLPVPNVPFTVVPAQRAAVLVLPIIGAIAVIDLILILAITIAVVILLTLIFVPGAREEAQGIVRLVSEELRRALERATRRQTDVSPEPDPRKGPDRPPPPPLPVPCPAPTGLTPVDPIPFVWFKLPEHYPSPIDVGGAEYARDTPAQLPHGEPIGVPDEYWPGPGKIVQLAPDERGPNAGRFRAVLEAHGFDWQDLQADHVQDLQWGRPDGRDLDVFENLWPMDASANTSAGGRQNNNQSVTFCETFGSGLPRTMTLRAMKAAGRAGAPYFGRYFIISRIER